MYAAANSAVGRRGPDFSRRKSVIVSFQLALFYRLLCGAMAAVRGIPSGMPVVLENRSANLRTAATPNPPICLFTVADGISTEDLLVNLSETLASANALSCDLAFDLDGPKREELLGVAQLIELAQLLAERVHKGIGQSTAPA